jgi:DNA polymerase III epsilon subunit-like protein
MPIILVFDTETTGLTPLINMSKTTYKERKTAESLKMSLFHSELPNVEAWSRWSEKWNQIIQLSYILYNTDTNEFLPVDKYAELPEELVEQFLGDPESHYTITDSLREYKKAKESNNIFSLNDVLHEFLHHFSSADLVVGHNVEYDKNMILSELMRLHLSRQDERYLKSFIEIQTSNKFICTAELGKNICRFERTSKTGKSYFKTPRLNELYLHLFGHSPIEEKLHNALNDVIITFRCFYFINYVEDIYGKNREIDELIDSITPTSDTLKHSDENKTRDQSRGIKLHKKSKITKRSKIYKKSRSRKV